MHSNLREILNKSRNESRAKVQSYLDSAIAEPKLGEEKHKSQGSLMASRRLNHSAADYAKRRPDDSFFERSTHQRT